MTFKHKISRRLALAGCFAAGLALVACEDEALSGPEAVVPPNAELVAAEIQIGDRVQATHLAYLRTGPSVTTSLAGTQPVGAVGTLVEGPVLDADGDKLLRWRVDFDSGVDGWGAHPYFNKVGSASVKPAPFFVGARVRADSVAYLRSDPTVNSTMVGTQPVGSTGTVFAGPVLDTGGDGLYRWRIDFDTGPDGWGADLYISLAGSDTTSTSGLTVSPKTAMVQRGSTTQLTAVVKDAGGNVLSSMATTWRSRDSLIARVSSAGVVTGVAVGATYVLATSGGMSDSAAISVTAPAAPTVRPGYYAAPNGSSGASGSFSQPWDLATALAGGNGRIRPGDTLWVRGGTYRGAFAPSVSGTAGNPVVIRAYPGERAIIDGSGYSNSTLQVLGPWTVYWGLEVINSDPSRVTSSTSSHTRTNTVVNNASNTKYVNLIVHDGGVAFYNYENRSNVEVYGSIFYNNGWQGPVRGHGHALYAKASSGPVVLKDNVLFNQFGYGIHTYTDPSAGGNNNIRVEGNVAFNNGTVASNSNSANILIGGEEPVYGSVLIDNLAYFSPGYGNYNLQIGFYSTRNADLVMRGNYAVGGATVLNLGYWTSVMMQGNTFIGPNRIVELRDPSTGGHLWSTNEHRRNPTSSSWSYNGSTYAFSSWKSATGVAATDVATGVTPGTPKVVVRPNQYEPGRATVTVYNWSGQGSVTVPMSGLLPVGATYEVRSVQRLFGTPLATGTFGGGSITIPLTAVQPPVPIGMSSTRAPVTGPAFDVFIITIR